MANTADLIALQPEYPTAFVDPEATLTIFEALSKELSFEVTERFGGGSIKLRIEGSTPATFDIIFLAADVQRCVAKIGDNPYGYFFKMPLTLMSKEFWTIEDIKALGYFAEEDLVEAAFDNKAGLDTSELNELFAFIKYCGGIHRTNCFKVVVSVASHSKGDDARKLCTPLGIKVTCEPVKTSLKQACTKQYQLVLVGE